MDRTSPAIGQRRPRVESHRTGEGCGEKTVERNDSMVMDETMRTEGLTRRDSYRSSREKTKAAPD